MIRPTQFNKWTNRTFYHHNPRRMTNRRTTRSAKKGVCRANNRCNSISQSGVIQTSYCFIWLKSGNWTLTSGSFNSHTMCGRFHFVKKNDLLGRYLLNHTNYGFVFNGQRFVKCHDQAIHVLLIQLFLQLLNEHHGQKKETKKRKKKKQHNTAVVVFCRVYNGFSFGWRNRPSHLFALWQKFHSIGKWWWRQAKYRYRIQWHP